MCKKLKEMVSVLNEVVNIRLIRKMAFEQSLQIDEGIGHQIIFKKSNPSRVNSQSKDPKHELAWHIQRTAVKPVVWEKDQKQDDQRQNGTRLCKSCEHK